MDCCRVCGAHTYHANGQMCNRKKRAGNGEKGGRFASYSLLCGVYVSSSALPRRDSLGCDVTNACVVPVGAHNLPHSAVEHYGLRGKGAQYGHRSAPVLAQAALQDHD